jgi:hypothetical protein
MKEHASTREWLEDSLEITGPEDASVLEIHGTRWIHVAGLRRCGSILAVYKDDARMCAHAGYDDEIRDFPSFGYFPLDLPWHDLLDVLAARYDDIRSSTTS